MTENSEFRRAYKPLLGATVGAGCGLSSVCFYTHGVFAVAIAADTGWSRGSVQAAVSIMILLAIVTAPVAGWLVDRGGARKVALTSMLAFGIALAGISVVPENVWMYYAAWVLMSIVGAGTLPVTWTKVVIGWFDKNRGIALGITLAGTGIAATFAPGYVTWLIDQVGWRGAYAALGATVLAISLPAVYLFLREAPANPETAASASVENPGTESITLTEALRGYRFWAIAVGIVFAAAGISGLITNIVPMLTDKGITAAAAASYAGLIGVSVIFGRLLVGLLLDRVWAPLVAGVFLAAPSVAALILIGDSTSPVWIGGAALIIGLAAGAELDLLAFLASRYFGLRHYGSLYGALYVAFSIGAGLAPVTFGRAYDRFGDYDTILGAVVAMSALGGILMLTLGRYPSTFRQARSR
jgi:MFS family permease